MLKKRGIKHNVLNAKYHEMEAQIVAEAGQHGAVTIATNMAGRGTDIKLDEEARAAGGLKIIGTERHESRRIDNQLRGRSGRQGDPGESRFFLSLEDDLMRLFGSEKILGTVSRLGLPEEQPIDVKILSNSIESAQKRLEDQNFTRRKNVLSYDDVMNMQRTVIYKQRGEVLDGLDLKEKIRKIVKDALKNKKGILSVHGVFINQKEKRVSLDIGIDFALVKQKSEITKIVEKEISKIYPNYTTKIVFDMNYSDF
mgnify:CR=1 FL=1